VERPRFSSFEELLHVLAHVVASFLGSVDLRGLACSLIALLVDHVLRLLFVLILVVIVVIIVGLIGLVLRPVVSAHLFALLSLPFLVIVFFVVLVVVFFVVLVVLAFLIVFLILLVVVNRTFFAVFALLLVTVVLVFVLLSSSLIEGGIFPEYLADVHLCLQQLLFADGIPGVLLERLLLERVALDPKASDILQIFVRHRHQCGRVYLFFGGLTFPPDTCNF